MELLTSILSKDFIDLAPPDANAPEEGTFLFLQGISVQNDKYKIIIKVGSSYISISIHFIILLMYQGFKQIR